MSAFRTLRSRIGQAVADYVADLGLRIAARAMCYGAPDLNPEVTASKLAPGFNPALDSEIDWMERSLMIQQLPKELVHEFRSAGLSRHALDVLLLGHATLMADETDAQPSNQ